ncbi:GDSL-type esterase/lipase family protein [Butyrivibrio sp. WCD3002]|uniref:GDSL-type esterase/lipase family protein n=1 Tax=Butyrivibrio sp. WCD3002 TaxID=1280676 RepID=UPI00041EA129|nr:GDSL-type esterase/lipase family protein [Butyrivibrio sp. WCD3002]
MKKLSKYLLTILVMLFYLLATADSILGKDTQYREIEYDPQEAPVMSLTLRNLFDGNQPYLVALANNMMGTGSAQLSQDPDSVEQSENNEIADNSDQEQPSDNPEQPENPAEGENPEAAGEALADGQQTAENQEMPTEDTAAEVPVEVPVEEQIPEPPVYQLATVDDDYFCDALFIGDSRTVGLSEYCQELMDRSTFYAKISLTIYDFEKKAFLKLDENSEKITIAQALEQKKFGKIYIMLGLNELGGGTPESFGEAYAGVVGRIRELQPDAQIYIQGIMHVTAAKSNNDKVFKNERINERNQVIAQIADNQHVFYLDMNEATDDENGALTQDLSFDNIHLKAKSYALWYDYLKNHAYVIAENIATE